ncbi:kinase-like domain-containing protein [Mycena pura]|uniref:Kinase-like domain-containing protein n=1 Tax=Mycena pura TaxID=153505 RepID=A0AAD6YQH7_9AGAR|nr:kinase-like domain-containing protein [Mycena pura]
MSPTPPGPASALGTGGKGMPSFIGAVKDEWELFSDCSTDYTVGAPIGFGASSIVYAAEYRPESYPQKAMPCALKVLDLDSLPPHSLALLQRETNLMSLSKHPNVLRVRGSWMDGHKLCIALRLMNRGSAADIMRYGWPGGMDEDVIRCILSQALQGLNYLHVNGFIHRDIKAANLLIDDDGTVLLGDLGVAADLAEDTSHHGASSSHKRFQVSTAEAALRAENSGSGGHNARRISSEAPARKVGKRKSFVGTPCWMAPEVIEARHYDSSADIWSFGITALELAQGRPPRSREPPQRVLLKTLQEAPPSLDREGGTYKYSRAFKELIDSCLVKDPSKRPTAQQLLESPFFKSTKKKSYLVGAILKDLPPLTQRQERRVARGASVHGTVDSWDFATTINSPHSVHHMLLEQSTSEEPEDTVFEMEDEQKRWFKAMSWREEADVLEEGEPESTSSSPSDQEHSDAQGSGSSISSPAPDSPYVGSMKNEGEEQIPTLTLPMGPLSPPKPVPVPGARPSESLGMPGSSSMPSSLSQSPRSNTGMLSSSMSSSRSSPGLWKRIKGATGLKRPSSSPNTKAPLDTLVGK